MTDPTPIFTDVLFEFLMAKTPLPSDYRIETVQPKISWSVYDAITQATREWLEYSKQTGQPVLIGVQK